MATAEDRNVPNKVYDIFNSFGCSFCFKRLLKYTTVNCWGYSLATASW